LLQLKSIFGQMESFFHGKARVSTRSTVIWASRS
jgi:hypothetical protein